MNKYIELKKEIERRYNEFPFMFAFNNEQFKEGLKKLNAEVNEICSLGAGGYIRKADIQKFNDLTKWAKNAQKEAIKADVDGSGFIKDMFLYELGNHEYCITCDLSDTLRAVGIKFSEVQKDEKLKRGLSLAIKEYKESMIEA
jgi:hypothetical protein